MGLVTIIQYIAFYKADDIELLEADGRINPYALDIHSRVE